MHGPIDTDNLPKRKEVANVSYTSERHMSDSSEKRKYPRSASLKRCAVRSTAYDSPVMARIINENPYGLLLELDYPLPVEEVPIKIYPADEMRGIIDYETSEYLVGMVRWCRQEQGGWSGMYQAGIEIVFLKPRKDII